MSLGQKLYRTLIIDLDGPLLDIRARHYACYRDLLVAAGFSPISEDSYWTLKRRRVPIVELLAKSEAGTFLTEFRREWPEWIERDEYLERDRIQPGVVEKLGEWRQAGLSLIACTMRRRAEAAHQQLARLGLSPLLSRIVCVSQRGSVPSTKGAALRKVISDVPMTSLLWIGDTEEDFEAARTLGCDICLVTCGLRDRAYLETLERSALVERLAEIPAAWTFPPTPSKIT